MQHGRLKRRLQRWSAYQRKVHGSVRPALVRKPAQRTTTIEQSTCFFDGVEMTTPAGKYWHIEKPLAEFFAGTGSLWSRWQQIALRRDIARRALFLDLETCGFAGSAIFLVGLLSFDKRGPVLVQLWARTYAEEAAMLSALQSYAANCTSLFTFNGKSFDWPQVRDRTVLHTRDPNAVTDRHHVDLLHVSRRKFKGQFPDCRLQTLEQHVCRRHREGDIPGREIPEVYADYVRTGNVNRIQSILHHNALDLVTLWELAIVCG